MDKADLLRARVTVQEVEIPDVGTVTVRAMTVEQQGVWSTLAEGDVTKFNRHVLAGCLVDPALTVDEAGAWMRAATAGEVQTVLGIINELSGVGREAKELQKEIFKSVRKMAGIGVRGVAGSEAEPHSS